MKNRDHALDLELSAIGWVRHGAEEVPRHWTVSDLEGDLDIRPELADGLADIAAGQKILVIFVFDRSPPFSFDQLTQETRHSQAIKGVFSICSPKRPNPIGLSVLEVLAKEGCRLRVRGLDMFDGTPILDIKPTLKPDD
ncbi:MAG: SAM-dependent methyltransferase [Desulfobacterales bacterium]|nr:SAM-dependent methyltransferase [Desulfobacterales bacterium]